MALRTTPEKVAAAVKVRSDLDVAPAIDTANALTDYVAEQDTGNVLSDALLVEIETYLAAHFYALLDPQYRQQSRGKASGSFVLGREGQGLQATPWGQQALAIDVSGTLATMSQGKKKAKLTWLGKTEREAIDHWTR